MAPRFRRVRLIPVHVFVRFRRDGCGLPGRGIFGPSPRFFKEEPSFKIEHEQAECRVTRAAARELPEGGPRKAAEEAVPGVRGDGQKRLAHGSAVLECSMQARLGGERPADFGAEQIHILADLVRVRVFESGSVLAELPGHAGHGDLAHAVAAGCGEAFGDEVADTDEGGCGQLRQVDLRAGFGAPASAEDHCRTAGKKVRFHADADGMDVGFMAVGTDQAGGA